MKKERRLTPEQIAAYRLKLADPLYMETAIGEMSVKMIDVLVPKGEPKVNDDGRKRCPTYND